MTANDVFVDYDIEYPEEMVSFKWLHRKRYDVHGSTAGQLADELFNELRIGFAQTEKRRLEKLAEKGQSEYLHIYEKDVRGMKGALLWLCISFVSSLLIMYTGLYEKSFAFLLILLAAIFAAVGVGYICYTLMASLCARYELFNVSVLFKEFKNRTARRVCAILGIGMWTGIFYLAYLFLDIADKRDANMNIALISVFVIIIALTIVGLVKASVLDSTAFTSAHYIELCERRPKTHITFIIVYAIVFAALFVGSLIILL